VAIGLVTLGVMAGVGLLGWRFMPHAELTLPVTAPSAPAVTPTPVRPATAPPAPSTTPAPDAATPRFDIVRVTQQGSAVIAGRAAPGSIVAITDGGHEIGRATADASGAFIFTPDTPLAPGVHELNLRAADLSSLPATPGPPSTPGSPASSGSPAAPGNGGVLVVIPAPSTPSPPAPLAVLTPEGPGGDNLPRLLQGPASLAKDTAPGVDVLDYDAAGHLRLAGHAAPGASLSFSLDNHPAGTAQADAAGHWAFALATAVPPGAHRLDLTEKDAKQQVLAGVSLPFRREALAGKTLAPGTVMVQPGENLWKIARATYGSGVHYTLIFQANRTSIHNPKLIYPGQTLRVPAAP
jgi:nucleoid-associated protein YgaU